jgi:hypothetical protein
MQLRRIKKFKRWLEGYGCEILPPTNDFEALRFVCSYGTGVVYHGKKGVAVSSPWVREAYDHYLHGKKWAGKVKPTKRGKSGKLKIQIIARDGWDCFFCGDETNDETFSVEHLIPLVQGGPDNLANVVCACVDCNNEAGRKSITEKIKMRDKKRQERAND